MEFGQKFTAPEMAWGGATPPQGSTPQWGGATDRMGGVGGARFFVKMGAPPHSGGEHLVFFRSFSGFLGCSTPQWGGAIVPVGGSGGEHFSNFPILTFQKVHPTVGGAWGEFLGLRCGEGGALPPMGKRAM